MPEDIVGTSADTVSATAPTTPDTGTPPTTAQAAPTDTPTVVVTIDGRQQEVPVDEVVKGYQRQADYTRKTQALSQREAQLAEADQLWQAFQADPVRTLQVLQEYYGDVGQPTDNEQEPDPYQARLDALEAQQQDFATRELMLEIEDQVDELREEYGDVDRDELLQFAIDHEIPDLEAALLKMRTVSTRESRIAERNAQALARKQNLAPIAGGSRADGALARSQGPINSVSDALAEAMAELGIDSIPRF